MIRSWQDCGIEEYTCRLHLFRSAALENRTCRHPFMERDSLLVLADYVTLEAGTGCVHTAPGHGADDYLTGLRYGLDILSPVDDEGCLYRGGRAVRRAARFPGLTVRSTTTWQARACSLHEKAIHHSYPHCWRCKKPVIYRATPQWFISMENK